MTWSYYDFDANIADFIKVWNYDYTQSLLYQCIRCLYQCESVEPQYDKLKNKEALPYEFSPDASTWTHILNTRVHAYVKEHNLISRYKQTMQQAGVTYPTPQALEQAFYNNCYNQLRKDLAPKPTELSAYVVFNGEKYLVPVMRHIAQTLFPNDNIYHIIGRRGQWIIAIENAKLLFDINGYFIHKYPFTPQYIKEIELDANDPAGVTRTIAKIKEIDPNAHTIFSSIGWLNMLYDEATYWEEYDDWADQVHQHYSDDLYTDW